MLKIPAISHHALWRGSFLSCASRLWDPLLGSFPLIFLKYSSCFPILYTINSLVPVSKKCMWTLYHACKSTKMKPMLAEGAINILRGHRLLLFEPLFHAMMNSHAISRRSKKIKTPRRISAILGLGEYKPWRKAVGVLQTIHHSPPGGRAASRIFQTAFSLQLMTNRLAWWKKYGSPALLHLFVSWCMHGWRPLLVLPSWVESRIERLLMKALLLVNELY